MIKKLITILVLTILASCSSWTVDEVKKTGKAAAASSRINSSDNSSKDILKELDE